MTRALHREPVSYHLLCDALTVHGTGGAPPHAFARAVQRVVCGLVPHAHYAGVARAAAQDLPLRRIRRQLADAVAADANPVAALFTSAAGMRGFEARWNALNQAAHFGVKTRIERLGSGDEKVDRTPVAGAGDDAFRAELMAQLLDVLSGAPRTGIADDSRAIVALAQRCGVREAAVHEVLDLLHDEPGIGIDECARLLGVSLRTLQRQLARHGVLFTQLKQAVRIAVAGHRMRHGGESLTEIAQGAGFYDSAHLVHAWRGACGAGPGAYRTIAWVSDRVD